MIFRAGDDDCGCSRLGGRRLRLESAYWLWLGNQLVVLQLRFGVTPSEQGSQGPWTKVETKCSRALAPLHAISHCFLSRLREHIRVCRRGRERWGDTTHLGPRQQGEAVERLMASKDGSLMHRQMQSAAMIPSRKLSSPHSVVATAPNTDMSPIHPLYLLPSYFLSFTLSFAFIHTLYPTFLLHLCNPPRSSSLTHRHLYQHFAPTPSSIGVNTTIRFGIIPLHRHWWHP